jgi:hypothetical protein
MTKNDSTHPVRSADFLSRLHDGELTAAERARFESHRAHCAECRAAASEFEAALSLFRASTTAPPPPDLPARILRKLRSTTQRRPPFGVVFGINLKWAAAFSTALLAVIVGSAVVFQRDRAQRNAARATAIPVMLRPQAAARQEPAPSGAVHRERARAPKAPNAVARQDAPPAPARAPAPAPAAASGEERFASSPTQQPAAATERKARVLNSRAGPGRAEEQERSPGIEASAPSGRLRKSEAAGGEGAPAPSAASAEPGPPARLVVVSLDGEGGAPEIVGAGAAERLSDLRGHRYVLIVEASGRVREARAEGRQERVQKRAMAKDAVEVPAAPPAIRSLRFRAGDRPRRLLLRIE